MRIEAFALVVVGLLLIYSSSYQASNLAISDSVEYAVTATQLADGQDYHLQINASEHPPRYWPFFSALVLSPVYKLLGSDDLGHGIRAIQFFAVLAIVFAYQIGKRISGAHAGVGAVLILLLIPGFRYFSQQIMSEIPSVALVLGLYLCYTSRRFLIAGLIIAALTSFRPSYVVYLVPFLILSLKEKRLSILLKCTWPVMVVLASAIYYNLQTFGSYSFSGYQYWVPEFYADSSKTFSIDYLKQNVFILLKNTEVIVLAFLCVVLIFTSGNYKVGFSKLGEISVFVLWSGLPLCAFFLLYFFPSSHFYLTIEAMLALMAGASIPVLNKRAGRTLVWVLVFVALAVKYYATEVVPQRRISADNIAELVSDDSMIISGLDPVYLGYFLRQKKNIEILPISRRIEYASKSIKIGPNALPNQQWISTALESPNTVTQALSQNLAVYIETAHFTAAETKQFDNLFITEMITANIGKVIRLKR